MRRRNKCSISFVKKDKAYVTRAYLIEASRSRSNAEVRKKRTDAVGGSPDGRASSSPPHTHIPPYPKTALLVRGLRLGGHDGELGRWRRQGLVHGRLLVLLGGAGLLRPAPMVVLGRLELGRRGSDDLQASPSSTRSAHARRRRPRDSRSSQIHHFVCTSSSLSLSVSLCLSLSSLLALRCLADARRQFLPKG